jgi:hypothetical protein
MQSARGENETNETFVNALLSHDKALQHFGGIHIVPFEEGPELWQNAIHNQAAEDALDWDCPGCNVLLVCGDAFFFATPEGAEACNARVISPALSRAQSNASHAQASYNSNAQLFNELSLLWILAMITAVFTAVLAFGSFGRDVRRVDGMRSPLDASGNGATHVPASYNNTPSIDVPQNPGSTGEGMMQLLCPSTSPAETALPTNNDRAPFTRALTSRPSSAKTMENAQILAPAVPPVSDATSEPDNTTTPSPRQHSVDEMRSERLLKKRSVSPT